MSFRKSDILFLGQHSNHAGCLAVRFDSRPGSAELIVLREVLELFDSQVVANASFGFITDLPFAELGKLNKADSFPEMESRRIAAEEEEAEKKKALEIRQRAEQAIRDEARREIEKRREAQHQIELAHVKETQEREEAMRQKIAEGKRLAEKLAQDKLNKKIAELTASQSG